MKRIIIINQGPIYPMKAMNQVRTHNMMRVLSESFVVDMATSINSKTELTLSEEQISKFGGKFYSLGSLKPKNNLLIKRSVQLGERIAYYLFGTDPELFQHYFYRKRILELIHTNKYDIVISNYWENSLFFKSLSSNVYKILDPHYAVEENFEVASAQNYSGIKRFLENRRLVKNRKNERTVVENSDLILPLSQKTFSIFNKLNPDKELLLVADGNDLDHYFAYPRQAEENTILFYGAMGSKQNINAFFRFFYNVLPVIKKHINGIRILGVGADPPDEISALHNGADIIITGFVEDVRPWLAKAWLKIIPLELGSGFRGRVVELMAMGIPVAGTHNALDSIGFENGKEGFISDDDNELSDFCVHLFKNPARRNEISVNAKRFVKDNYSLEATFGKLEKFLSARFN
ncbi:MAG: glycosyltransferase [Bacteroidota bacterium]